MGVPVVAALNLDVILTKANFRLAAGASPLWQWCAFITTTLLVSWLLAVAGFPSAILLGPMLVAIVFGVRGSAIRTKRPLLQFAQAIAGCLIAQNLTYEILHHAVTIWPAVVISVSLTLISAGIVGLLFSRWTIVPDREAMWGFLPGMAGSIIAMAHERGIDSRIVAVIQIVRLVAVILAMSVLSRLMAPGAMAAAASDGDWHSVLATILIALTGVIGSRLIPSISATATMIPMVLGGILQSSGLIEFHVPFWLLVIAYLLIGTDTGLKFTPAILRDVLRYILPLAFAVAVLLVLSAALGMLLVWVLHVDMLTAILATVPGSIDSVALIAINSGADISFVITIQVVRLFAVLLIGPYVVGIIASYFPKPLKQEA
jgi:membrane AbrB-like protein